MDGRAPARIPRFLKNDRSGVLYIGMTSGRTNGRLSWRLRCLRESAIGKRSFPHPGGVRFYWFGSGSFDLGDLEVSWLRTRSAEDAKRIERNWLEEYEASFGELPPLNRSGGRRTSGG
jgi:hypothetical protein